MYKCSKSGCNTMIEKRGYCNPHHKEYHNKYYQKTRSKHRVKLTEEELKARKNARSRSYNQANRKKLNEAMRNWRQTEKGSSVDKSNKSRRRTGDKKGFTAKEWRELCEKYNHTCLACGCTNCQLTPDHVIPLSKGGSNYIDNIQPLCLPCNLKKATQSTDYRNSLYSDTHQQDRY